MSKCAGAGRVHSQAAGPSWPMEILHTMDVMLSLSRGVDWGEKLFFVSSVFSLRLIFSMSSVFFHEFGEFCEICEFSKIHKIRKLQEIRECHDCCLGTGCTTGHRAVRKNVSCIVCFAHSLLLLLLFFIIAFFVVLLKCFYLNPQVLPFVHSLPHPAVEEGSK